MNFSIEKSNVQEIYEMNAAQKGMLYYYLKKADANLFNVQLSFVINGPFDLEIFKEGIRVVQAQHDVLRSAFRWEEVEKPLQIILKEYPASVSFYDVSHLEPEQADAFTRQHLLADRLERFDLRQLPLRFMIFKMADDQFRLNITN